MAGGVDEVENVFFPLVGIVKLYGAGFDGDTTLTLKVHVVEKLFFHFALFDGVGKLKDSVGKG